MFPAKTVFYSTFPPIKKIQNCMKLANSYAQNLTNIY